jgi:hypothetical protein
MSTALMEKLSQKRNLEAKWASEFIANGSVTVEMVRLSKKIEAITQELIDKSNEKK